MTSKTGLHDLIFKIARGDKPAYQEFGGMIRMPLTQHLTLRFGSTFDQDDIAEIVSQSILVVFLHSKEYRGANGDKSAWAWIYQIARSQAHKWLKTQKREIPILDGNDGELPSDDDELSRMMIRYNPELDPSTVEDQVEEKLLMEKLIEVLQQLSPREKTILHLYYVKGHSFSDIAREIGVKPPRITQIMQSILQNAKGAWRLTWDSL